jgi:CHAD domain-containing protein
MAKPLKIRKLSPDDRLEKAARRILRTRIKEFFSCWPDPDHPPTLEELHNLRISGKRLRYTAESLRELYPDRLALLIDLLKLNQDLLGEIQDCVTQRELVEAYIARLRRRSPQDDQIAALEKVVSEYEQRQSTLFAQFHETWRGMTMDEFRASLRAMVSRVKKTRRADEDHETREAALSVIATTEIFSVDQTGDDGLARRRVREQAAAEVFSVDQTGDEEVAHYRARELAVAESFSVDQTRDEARAEAVVNVDDGDVRGAGVEHS